MEYLDLAELRADLSLPVYRPTIRYVHSANRIEVWRIPIRLFTDHILNEVVSYRTEWGAVAEWVERRSLNPEVLGSNPIDAVSNIGQVRLPHVTLV